MTRINIAINLTVRYVSFQLNISYPATGCQKLLEVDDERKLRAFYDKRISAEVGADSLGDEWKVWYSVIMAGVILNFCLAKRPTI